MNGGVGLRVLARAHANSVITASLVCGDVIGTLSAGVAGLGVNALVKRRTWSVVDSPGV